MWSWNTVGDARSVAAKARMPSTTSSCSAHGDRAAKERRRGLRDGEPDDAYSGALDKGDAPVTRASGVGRLQSWCRRHSKSLEHTFSAGDGGGSSGQAGLGNSSCGDKPLLAVDGESGRNSAPDKWPEAVPASASVQGRSMTVVHLDTGDACALRPVDTDAGLPSSAGVPAADPLPLLGPRWRVLLTRTLTVTLTPVGAASGTRSLVPLRLLLLAL